ncbi:MAG TPA: hypothetical protein VGQ09_22985 [Chitinophagaceae bacterium]|jgi:hypothetical protein|nr:hypothetical protein [Chitinophagaceae bacterium]
MSKQKINKDMQSGPPSLKESEPEGEAFYIGWMPKAPNSFSSFIKKYLILLVVFVIGISITLALVQKKFGTGTFEFGKLTEVKGIYFNQPVPAIKAVNGKDIWGNISYITIPLVGYGKHGADGIIADIEKEKAVSLDKKEVILKGTLLYNDGKTILQIDKNDNPLITVGKTASIELLPKLKELGVQKIKGEIVDPKCYFGVMKPGEGKPHRDCAIRCILGGIPPVFHIQNGKGENNYYLVIGPNGEKMNEAVRDYVAEPTEIEARLVKYDDWIVMYVNDKQKIKRISYLNLIRDNIATIGCAAHGCQAH